MSAQPLLYLSGADVVAAMPPVEERLDLARQMLVALVDSAELPAKVGVHPRQPASHTAAMPALLRAADVSGAADLLGIKWVTAFPGNRDSGVAAVNALVVLNDPTTGIPIAILDGGPITAQRTAAVSGVALREWMPSIGSRAMKITLAGAGIQGESHVHVLAHVAPGCALTIVDRNAGRAEELASRAGDAGVFAEVVSSSELDAAIAEADVVLTMVSFGAHRQAVPARAFARAGLIVAVDYDMCIPASVAVGARQFLVDDIGQFDATRSDSVFVGYPRPDASIGQALNGSAPAPRRAGPIVVNHLGVGLADVVFADAIVRRAAQLGLGVELPR